MHVRVGDGDAGRRGDVARGGLALAALAQIHDHRLVVFAGEHDALDVQQDFGNVLFNTRQSGELVRDAAASWSPTPSRICSISAISV